MDLKLVKAPKQLGKAGSLVLVWKLVLTNRAGFTAVSVKCDSGSNSTLCSMSTLIADSVLETDWI